MVSLPKVALIKSLHQKTKHNACNFLIFFLKTFFFYDLKLVFPISVFIYLLSISNPTSVPFTVVVLAQDYPGREVQRGSAYDPAGHAV